MTEFAVGLAVMALMLLGSITIAAYQETQRRTSIAARQATFQGAWSGVRDDQAAVLRSAAEFQLEDPAMVDAVGHRYVSASDISAAASIQPAEGLARTAARALVDPLRVAGGFLGGGFDLSTGGMLAGALTMNIPPNPGLPEPFSAMSVELRQPFAVMTDAWNASGANHVRSRTAGLVPTSTLFGPAGSLEAVARASGADRAFPLAAVPGNNRSGSRPGGSTGIRTHTFARTLPRDGVPCC